MPITIQEIIASDTISQLVDKTNFNFDQLLLNGGGPAGPIGPAGPTGPAGGRGPKGTTWYEDLSVSAPGNTPIAVPPTATPLEGDYYLQFDGLVWEYTGLTWSATNINLTGPTGPAGQDGGFGEYFGQGTLVNLNTLTPTPVGGGGTGANGSNQGIPTIGIGFVASNASQVGGITRNAAYQITDTLATTIASDEISLLIHQKNQNATAIRFMGGGLDPNENYSQGPFTNFASLAVMPDDGLIFNIPKRATLPGNNNDVNGFTITSPARGAIVRMGGQVNLSSGSNNNPYTYGGENGNFNISVGAESGGGGNGNQLQLVTQGATGSTQILAGNNITIPSTTLSTGKILFTAAEIHSVTGGRYTVNSAANIDLVAATSGRFIAGTSSSLALNAQDVVIGMGTGSVPTRSISMGATVPGASTIGITTNGAQQAGVAISLKTYGTSSSTGTISIIADNPGVSGGVSIKGGSDATKTGYIDIDSNNANLSLASNLGNTILSTSDGSDLNARIELASPTGLVTIGGNGALFPTAPSNSPYKALLQIYTESQGFQSPTAGNLLNRVVIGDGPTGQVNLSGLSPFYGGSELSGVHAGFSGMGSTVGDVEYLGAFNITGGLRADGYLPGSIYISGGKEVGAFATRPANGIIDSSVGIWSNAVDFPSAGGTGSVARGTTIGLNKHGETGNLNGTPNGDNVVGRTYLYGIPSTNMTGFGQSSQTDIMSGSEYDLYAGVNIGDYRRGRQTFKVWGDYNGSPYISVFDGAFSGPSIENQTFFSGAQDWSTRRTNAGTNNADDDLAFKYKYQWSRTGRVVTGSGLIKLYVNWDGGNNGGTSIADGAMFTPANASFNSQMKIGPIPLPMQVNRTGGNRTDTTSFALSNLAGIQAVNIAGAVTSKFDFDNQQTNLLGTNRTLVNGTISGISFNGPFPTGDVRGGSATTDNGTDPGTSVKSEFMWLSVLSAFSNSYQMLGTTYHGMYAPIMSFTFTYELNA